MEELKLEQLNCFCKMHPDMYLLSFREDQNCDILSFPEETDME
jgi:hypothetical protein